MEAWPPEDVGNSCTECGAHVTKQFARVFGKEGCVECTTYRELQRNE
jgi:hypothetical protein